MARRKTSVADAGDPGQYLPLLARQHADSVRPRKRGGPWPWSEALARAPWSAKLPAAWENAFRRAYAERLVELGLALPAAKPGTTSGPSGKTDLKGRLVYMTQGELDDTAARAHQAGLSWSAWARRKLTE